MPGDKSISHRAALISALAKGQTLIENFASSADCVATLACLQRLGIDIERAGHDVTIIGEGLFDLHEPPDALDCANSGTTMRMLAGLVAGQAFTTRLVGDTSLSSRPMDRIAIPLEQMGARVVTTEGHAPIEITGREPLQAITYELPIASAQIKSCILIAGLLAEGRTEVISATPTRDHTERMMRWFGIDLREEEVENGTKISVTGPAHYAGPERMEIPGDISSAAFFMAAAAILPGSDLHLQDVGLNSTRAKIVDVLRMAGADITVADEKELANEPVGTIMIHGPADRFPLSPRGGPITLEGPMIAQLIDELPMLAVLGTQLEGGLIIRNAAELRLKESDRIAATVANLRAMGARVQELPDGMQIDGPVALRGAMLDTHRDHRIAMAFAVAALWAEGETEIEGAEDCIGVSCPEFFTLLDSVVER